MSGARTALILGMAGLLLVSSGHAQLGGLFSANGRIRRAVVPIYMGRNPEPSMILRAESIYKDYERKAFFRIGALPVKVAEGVSFEIRDIESVTNSLALLDRWLSPRAAERLELRQAAFQIGTAAPNRLQAGRVRVRQAGRWELDGGVHLQIGTNGVHASSATLQVAGSQTGTLVMDTRPPWTTNIFSIAKS
ncbi:MAG TPA: hypothetical protein P5555_07165 [Candidatus Paceibacterota bacterium]|nr:hypothetical protein [Verrucomicrobiota bacterium]HOX02103.1 hypothetical protein [Verrucomicrobiota bacterium]HRZ44955.1 hypothetical protein [Candidatus Paceibacterota bacterium]